MIRLDRMTPAELEAYLAFTMPQYAAEKVKSGNWAAEDAEELSRKTYQQLLPNGVESPDQHLFVLRNEDNAHVGYLWVAKRKGESGKDAAWVYDVVIFEEFRRRGYAREAFQQLEEIVRGLGLAQIALHVFGHNRAARSLYENLGYAVTNVLMAKDL